MSVEQILNKELQGLKVDIINRHIRAGQKATGQTAASLRVKTQPYSGQLYGAEYIGVLEKGRKAGKLPYDFKAILIAWAKAKGITFGSQKELNSFAYLLAQKIKREGTKTFHVNQDIFTTPVKQFRYQITNKISKYYLTQITNKIHETK